MNPYTRSLLQRIENPALHDWVEAWDQLESLVVEIYRTEAAGPDAQNEYRDLKQRLITGYERWKDELRPHWDGLQAGGEPVQTDPFQKLLEPESAQGFLENWRAMQTLPAAREALNSYLIALIEGAESGDLDAG